MFYSWVHFRNIVYHDCNIVIKYNIVEIVYNDTSSNDKLGVMQVPAKLLYSMY